MGEKTETLLKIKCVGDGCKNYATVTGPTALVVDDIAVTCNDCKKRTGHKLKREKATDAQRWKSGQLKLDVEAS